MESGQNGRVHITAVDALEMNTDVLHFCCGWNKCIIWMPLIFSVAYENDP